MSSICAGSFFTRSKMNIRKIVAFMHLWSLGVSTTEIQNQLTFTAHTAIDWTNFMRELASQWMEKLPPRLGEESSDIVEIDELILGAKRKYQRGRAQPGMKQWIFGLIERRRKLFVAVPVSDRSAATLCALVEKYVAPGCTIHSDSWASYSSLTQCGYRHRTVNHSEEFVTPEGIHTNTIEGQWAKLREYFRHMYRTQNPTLKSHLDWFCYRKMVKDRGDNDMSGLVIAIKEFYPVHN